MNIILKLTTAPKTKPADESKLGFGKLFTDHMFMMDFTRDKGWHDARIVPYGPLSLDPSATVLHYSQSIFEGMKAYREDSGKIRLFRPRDNFIRLNTSARRLSIPEIDVDNALAALHKLINIEQDWVPSTVGASLYIRPTIIADDPFLGVHAADKYIFFIILSPSGAYYPQGLAPIDILVEKEYVRSVRGGLGYTKAGANYAASILAGDIASKNGFQQVLWLDGSERKYIEEVGSMNIFFKVNGEIWTPELSGSILPGITRDSVIKIARDMGITIIEKRIDVNELFKLGEDGLIEEVFGSGTAAVISPVGSLTYNGKRLTINNGEIGALSQTLYDRLIGIQYGKINDPYGWTSAL
ncbi:branched-chain-amino-acid aminotransferase 2 [Clostridia bacterium]|nr:branched-chain-amino-acid aminotransferase 2 [Clostridia bacterium]